MSLRIHHMMPSTTLKYPLKLQIHYYHSFYSPKPKLQVPSCKKKRISGSELATDLATQVAKLNSQMAQKEEALRKSREMLFTEFCKYVCMKEEEVKGKWKDLEEEDKWGLVKGFVGSEWAQDFQPLSVRCVKEMVEEYVCEDGNINSSSEELFPGLRRIIRFSQKK